MCECVSVCVCVETQRMLCCVCAVCVLCVYYAYVYAMCMLRVLHVLRVLRVLHVLRVRQAPYIRPSRDAALWPLRGEGGVPPASMHSQTARTQGRSPPSPSPLSSPLPLPLSLREGGAAIN